MRANIKYLPLPLVIAALMLIQTSLIGADEKFNLAVADLDAINVSMSDAVVVSEFIRSAFVNDRSFRVLERKNMDLILAEQAFQGRAAQLMSAQFKWENSSTSRK